METAHQVMAPIAVASTSGTNSQDVLPVSTGPSLSSLNTTLPSDTFPEELTTSRLLKISLVPKMPRKYSVSEKQRLYSK
jgi:hypothetical protein